MFPRIKSTFSIRSLLALILVVGVALGVAIVPYRQYRRQMAVAKELVAFRKMMSVDDGEPTVETRPCWQARLIGDKRTGPVTALRFYEPVDGERIARIAEFGDLETLCFFDGIDATEARLTPLAGLSSLRTLELEGPGFKDSDLALLKNFPRLESLALICDDFTDAGLDHLGELPRLRVLHLGFNEKTNSGAAFLSRLKGLRSLTLSTEFMNDADLDQVRKLPDLERLELSRLPITDDGLERLVGLDRLESLEITGSKIEGRGLAALARLPRLRELELSNVNELKDEGLDHLRQATRLRTLRVLDNEQIRDPGLERLKSPTHLEDLFVETYLTGAFSDAMVGELRKALPKTKIVASYYILQTVET